MDMPDSSMRTAAAVAAAATAVFGILIWYGTVGTGVKTVLLGQPISTAALGYAIHVIGFTALMVLAYQKTRRR
jgi:hypothetical protein